jgi:predicted nuclease of restriction endonuclease-like (RecB) superfamily
MLPNWKGIFVPSTSVQQLVALNPKGSVQQPAGLSIILLSLPWGHHMLLLDKIKEGDEALFYVEQTIEYNLYQRQGKAITNFTTTLSEKQALMALQMLKDPYLPAK